MELRNERGQTEQEFLEQYDPTAYPGPAVTVDMLLFAKEGEELDVLLVERKDHPFIRQYAIPGGFVNMDESLEAAAYRELKEETDVEAVDFVQLHTWGAVDRDPRTRVISTAYMAVVDRNELKPRAGDDAADVGWFRIKVQAADVKEGVKQTIISLTCVEKDKYIEFEVSEPAVRKRGFCETDVELKFVTEGVERLAADHGKIIYYALEKLSI